MPTPPAHESGASAGPKVTQAAASDRVVALVDDDEQICMALQEWLGLLDIPSKYYLNAEALMEALVPMDGHWWLHDAQGSRVRLAAAIVDLNMPGMHGLALSKALREHDPTLRVLVITAANADQRRRLADGWNEVALLRKPFTLEALEQALLPL